MYPDIPFVQVWSATSCHGATSINGLSQRIGQECRVKRTIFDETRCSAVFSTWCTCASSSEWQACLALSGTGADVEAGEQEMKGSYCPWVSKVGCVSKRSGGVAALLSCVHFTTPPSQGSLDVPVCLSSLPPSTPSLIFVQVWDAQLESSPPTLVRRVASGQQS